MKKSELFAGTISLTKINSRDRGFALILALWTLVVLSAIALTLAASVGAEVRTSQQSWNELQAERLSASGHEMAAYLEARFIGTGLENLVGLPVQPIVPGLTYRVTLNSGTVDLILEGENGKFDVWSANEEQNTAFFASWTGDSDRSREIAAAIADWIDFDNEPRLFGAESSVYVGDDYGPRNTGLGAADMALVRGLTPEDLGPAMITSNDDTRARSPLPRFLAPFSVGGLVNPNYASPTVLRAIAGMDDRILQSILEMRRSSAFTGPEDFRNRTGLALNSPLLARLTFDRGIAPAILAIAHLNNSSTMHTDRRTRGQIINPRQPRVAIRFTAVIERNISRE